MINFKRPINQIKLSQNERNLRLEEYANLSIFLYLSEGSDVRNRIKSALVLYPLMIKQLENVVKENFKEHLLYLNSLLNLK